jgi:ribosomal protein L11
MAAEEFDIQKRYEKKKEEERKKEKGIVDDKKKIVQIIKLEVMAGAAKPGPPIGPVLGQHQLNTAEFCKEFNKLTEKMEIGMQIPVLIYKKADRTFDLKLRSPTTTFYRTKFLKNAKMSSYNRYASSEIFTNVLAPKLLNNIKTNSILKSSESTVNINVNINKTNLKNFKTILSSLKSAKLKFFK